jgi:hypothetical protein
MDSLTMQDLSVARKQLEESHVKDINNKKELEKAKTGFSLRELFGNVRV